MNHLFCMLNYFTVLWWGWGQCCSAVWQRGRLANFKCLFRPLLSIRVMSLSRRLLLASRARRSDSLISGRDYLVQYFDNYNSGRHSEQDSIHSGGKWHCDHSWEARYGRSTLPPPSLPLSLSLSFSLAHTHSFPSSLPLSLPPPTPTPTPPPPPPPPPCDRKSMGRNKRWLWGEMQQPPQFNWRCVTLNKWCKNKQRPEAWGTGPGEPRCFIGAGAAVLRGPCRGVLSVKVPSTPAKRLPISSPPPSPLDLTAAPQQQEREREERETTVQFFWGDLLLLHFGLLLSHCCVHFSKLLWCLKCNVQAWVEIILHYHAIGRQSLFIRGALNEGGDGEGLLEHREPWRRRGYWSPSLIPMKDNIYSLFAMDTRSNKLKKSINMHNLPLTFPHMCPESVSICVSLSK